MANAGSGVLASLHLESIGGVAGDMLLAALLDLGADTAAVRAALASIGDPDLALEVGYTEIHGERACRVRSIARRGEGARHLEDVLAILERTEMSRRARDSAVAVFRLLAEAEAHSHGETAAHVHLHEVGELDSILDVVGIAVAFDSLGAPPATVGELPSGRGTVHTAHGTLRVPVPAVTYLAGRLSLPLVDVAVEGETVTPTGAAALGVFAQRFGVSLSRAGDRLGVGAGTRHFPDRPNVLRAHGYVR